MPRRAPRAYKLQAVRVGPWKLAIAPQPNGIGKAGASVPASLDHPRLYNLDREIGERTDVAAANLEVVARLKALAVKMAAELGDGKPGPAVREAGFVADAVTLYPTEDGGKKPGKEKKKAAANAGKLVSMNDLKIGDTLDSDHAPQIANRSITITCEVVSPGRSKPATSGHFKTSQSEVWDS